MTDLFDEPAERPANQLITAGRYRLPNLDGSPRPGGLRRASNTAAAISDARNLALWEQRTLLLGLAARHDLVEELQAARIAVMDEREAKDYLEGLAGRAKEAAGGSVGAARGTLRHTIVEDHHAGLPAVVAPATRLGGQLGNYAAALAAQRLEAVPGMQERIIVNEAVQSAGRFDNILRCQVTGALYIGDLKSQASFWSWLEILIQQAIYAYADAIAVWGPGGFERWEPMPAVSRERAIIMHMPSRAEHDEVHLYEIDIVKGWEFAQLAHEVCLARSAGRTKREPLGWRRVAPVKSAFAEAAAPELAAMDYAPALTQLAADAEARRMAPAAPFRAIEPEPEPILIRLADAPTPAEVRAIKAANTHLWRDEHQAAAVAAMNRLKNLAARA